MENILKYIPFVVLLIVSGCMEPVRLETYSQLSIGETIYVYGVDEGFGMNKAIKQNLELIGFIVKEERSNANLIADYKYRYDSYCNCIKDFVFFISDKSTGDVVLKLRYFPFIKYRNLEESIERALEGIGSKSFSDEKV